MQIDEDQLNASQKEKLADQMNVVSETILKLETADLASLSQEFKKRQPELEKAASGLQDDLNHLENAVKAVNVASTALNTISNIVGLIA